MRSGQGYFLLKPTETKEKTVVSETGSSVMLRDPNVWPESSRCRRIPLITGALRKVASNNNGYGLRGHSIRDLTREDISRTKVSLTIQLLRL